MGASPSLTPQREYTWWGAALYGKYQFTDIFSLATRLDYLHLDGVDAGGAKFVTGGADGDLWSWTLTAGFDIIENLILRAEYRADFGDLSGAGASNGPAHTFAAQAVYTF